MLKFYGTLILAGCLLKTQSAFAQELIVEKEWLTDQEVRAIYFSEEHGLVAGTGDGVVFYDSSISESLTHAVENAFPVSTFFKDSNSELWVGGLGHLRKITSEKSFTYSLNDDIGLSGRVIFSVSEDTNKGIWVSAPGGAAVCLNGEWKTYTIEDGLKHGVVHDACQADNGSMWFATRKGGLNILNDEGWEYQLLENNTRKLLKSSTGQIWVGTSEGLFTQEEEGWLLHSDPVTVLPVFQDTSSNVWCINNGVKISVVSADGATVSYSPLSDRVAEIYDMCIDKEGRVWLATNAGVFACRLG